MVSIHIIWEVILVHNTLSVVSVPNIGEVILSLLHTLGVVSAFNIWEVASIPNIGEVLLLYSTLRVVSVYNMGEVILEFNTMGLILVFMCMGGGINT